MTCKERSKRKAKKRYLDNKDKIIKRQKQRYFERKKKLDNKWEKKLIRRLEMEARTGMAHSVREVRGKSRAAVLVFQRCAYAYYLRLNGFSYTEIGSILNRAHCSIIWVVKKFNKNKKLYLKNKATRDIIGLIRQDINHNYAPFPDGKAGKSCTHCNGTGFIINE